MSILVALVTRRLISISDDLAGLASTRSGHPDRRRPRRRPNTVRLRKGLKMHNNNQSTTDELKLNFLSAAAVIAVITVAAGIIAHLV
jgi:hypothetical protein